MARPLFSANLKKEMTRLLVGLTPTGDAVGVGSIVCWAVGKSRSPGELIRSFRGWLLGHGEVLKGVHSAVLLGDFSADEGSDSET